MASSQVTSPIDFVTAPASQAVGIVFGPSGGTGVDKTWGVGAMANGAGRASNYADISVNAAGDLPPLLDWEFYTTPTSSPTAGRAFRIALAFSSVTGAFPGELTGVDAAASDLDLYAQFLELRPLAFNNSANQQRVSGTLWYPPFRYVQAVGYNDSGVALATGNDVTRLILRARKHYTP
jgi:hypothetical protein